MEKSYLFLIKIYHQPTWKSMIITNKVYKLAILYVGVILHAQIYKSTRIFLLSLH